MFSLDFKVEDSVEKITLEIIDEDGSKMFIDSDITPEDFDTRLTRITEAVNAAQDNPAGKRTQEILSHVSRLARKTMDDYKGSKDAYDPEYYGKIQVYNEILDEIVAKYHKELSSY